LAICRQSLRLSQCDLAMILGVETATLRSWEQGSCEIPLWVDAKLKGLFGECAAGKSARPDELALFS
jgi:DNA-binding XRE family transcriptional regulator